MTLHLEKRLTSEEFAKLPQGPPYSQLIDGEVLMTPSPVPNHQRISAKIVSLLQEFLSTHPVGEPFHAPLDVVLTDTDTFQPDILFISNNRKNIITEEKIIGAPDLVIEILSPSTAYYDLVHKKKVYESAGVLEYWIVDPLERFMEVFSLHDGRYTSVTEVRKTGIAKSRLLEGFEISAEILFSVLS